MKGQVSIFIIMGIVLLLIAGFAVYFTTREKSSVSQIVRLSPKLQPIHDAVSECISQVATEGLVKLGQTGGYIDTTSLLAHPFLSTEGNSVRFSPNSDLSVASWWFMKSKDSCTNNCEFGSKRPPLTRRQGGGSVQEQVEKYVNDNIGACVANINVPSCSLVSSDPSLAVDIAESITISGKYPVQVRCDQQSSDLDNFGVVLDLNLFEIYELATNITNLQVQENILEQATTTILQTFSGVNGKIPPFRALEFSAPSPGKFWIKFEVLKEVKHLLQSYIPAIQVFGTANYEYIRAPQNIRDPELFEIVYNRQFLIPLNKTYPTLETHFRYVDWWEPYFDLNCNGQLCQADSGTNFFLIPFSINRYEFAYDLSYPVLVEIKSPFAFQGKGYTFQFFLEQNLRNSAPFTTGIQLPGPIETNEPSIFCSPDQRTSEDVQLFVRDAESLQGADNVSISFECGDSNCNMGKTRNGFFVSRYPRCIGGALHITKPEYETAVVDLDTFEEKPQNVSVILEPIRTVKVSVKNYEIKKFDKFSAWKFEQAAGLSPHKHGQETLVLLSRVGAPHTGIASVVGSTGSEIKLVPGKYKINMFSLLRQNVVFPTDERCFRVKKIGDSDKKCRFIPEDPIFFNETAPFPYSMTSYEYEFTPEMLRGAKTIEFRQFVLAIDTVDEKDRIVEDFGELAKVQSLVDENPFLVWPVISK